MAWRACCMAVASVGKLFSPARVAGCMSAFFLFWLQRGRNRGDAKRASGAEDGRHASDVNANRLAHACRGIRVQNCLPAVRTSSFAKSTVMARTSIKTGMEGVYTMGCGGWTSANDDGISLYSLY